MSNFYEKVESDGVKHCNVVRLSDGMITLTQEELSLDTILVSRYRWSVLEPVFAT